MAVSATGRGGEGGVEINPSVEHHRTPAWAIRSARCRSGQIPAAKRNVVELLSVQPGVELPMEKLLGPRPRPEQRHSWTARINTITRSALAAQTDGHRYGAIPGIKRKMVQIINSV